MHQDANCVFCKIVAGTIPARLVHEDDELVVFHDAHPAAPVHLLVVPRQHISSMADVTDADAPLLGRMMALAPKLAAEHGLQGGFRQVVNTGRDGGQEVMHLHLHLMGGPRPWRQG